MNNNKLKEINDTFFISDLIKEINPYYRLFYNTKQHQYEVHDISNKHNSLCITQKEYPSTQTLKKLIQTKKDNLYTLFEQIEKHNQKLEQEQHSNLLNLSKDKLQEVLKHAERINHSLSPEQINKIIS